MQTDRYRITQGAKVDLAAFLTDDAARHDIEKASAITERARLSARLADLQETIYAQNTHRVLVVIQATDTGGKDGTLSAVAGPLNPQGVRVVPFKVPTEIERAHDFLWRVHSQVPADGEIVFFNRSHYEEVLIVRVHALVPERRWRAHYQHIRDFESYLVDEGITIVKLFLHISKDEQKARLQARLEDPTKHWKFNPADLTERRYWDDYQLAYAEAISETSTKHAPWYVIPADRKWFRNVLVAQILVDTLEALKPTYPADREGLSSIVIE